MPHVYCVCYIHLHTQGFHRANCVMVIINPKSFYNSTNRKQPESKEFYKPNTDYMKYDSQEWEGEEEMVV